MRRHLTSTLLASIGLVLGWGGGTAHASQDQETVLQDDPKIVFADSSAQLDRALDRVKALGVDRIRISVFWSLVAPDGQSEDRPSFGRYGPAWPGSYPAANWDRYDRIMRAAQARGLGVMLSVTGPAPAWAAGGREDHDSPVRPSARDFRDFVQAVGTRYSGLYSPDNDANESATVLSPQASAQPALPRADTWSLWNEPNFPAWLKPQWQREGRRYRPVSPILYRRLADAAWRGLRASGHGGDTILLGETAPYGPGKPHRPGVNGLVSPLDFTRELYCLGPSWRPYRGRAARVRGCPASAGRFPHAHPVLFQASGWAHHAYSLARRPTFRGTRRDAAPLGAIRRFERAIDRAQGAYSEARRWPVWVTEYGYQTDPPDPYRGVTWRRQESWMSWAEYLAFRDPRVRAFSQFLLVDDAPRLRFRGSRRWVTWQSGFITQEGEVKPGYREFKHPIYVARRGGSYLVFGMDRPPGLDAPLTAQIQYRDQGDWQILQTLDVTNSRGYVLAQVRPPGSGELRILWTDSSTGRNVGSRAVPFG